MAPAPGSDLTPHHAVHTGEGADRRWLREGACFASEQQAVGPAASLPHREAKHQQLLMVHPDCWSLAWLLWLLPTHART